MKKIISLFLSISLIAASVFSVDFSAFAFYTSEVGRQSVNTAVSIKNYNQFAGMADSKKSFEIPGLTSAVSTTPDDNILENCYSMVPQGMCAYMDYTLITAYDYSGEYKSVIYVLDSDKKLYKTLILPDCYHVGGIAYDKDNKCILIAKSSAHAVGVIDKKKFDGYLASSDKYKRIYYTVTKSTSADYVPAVSSVSYYRGRVYILNCATDGSGYLCSYTASFDGKSYVLKKKTQVSIPNYAQGVSFAEYNDKFYMFLSVSYGRNVRVTSYCSSVYVYQYSIKKGTKKLVNIIAAPPMLEQTSVKSKRLYCLFESAANPYYKSCTNPVDRVCSLSVKTLINGDSFVKISDKKVIGAKKITLSASVSGGTVYYSLNQPVLLGNGKIVRGKKYTSAIQLTSDTTVYCAVVKNNEIVSADVKSYTLKQVAKPQLKVKKTNGRRRITITSDTKNCAIYYTTDGSRPTVKSKKYSDRFSVKSGVTIRAIAVKKGYISSSVTTVKT